MTFASELGKLRELTTPRKINGWNLKITQLKRKIIWTKPSFSGSMLIFQGVCNMNFFSTYKSLEYFGEKMEALPKQVKCEKNKAWLEKLQ